MKSIMLFKSTSFDILFCVKIATPPFVLFGELRRMPVEMIIHRGMI